VFWIILIVLLALLVKFILHLVLPRNFAGTGEVLPLDLSSGPFRALYYCHSAEPKGIVILGTGDGGWSYWEENTARSLIAKGYAVGGWDCRKFADSRTYDQARLAEGFAAAVEAVRDRSHADDDVPIWYGGWSTGAEQSVAAAAVDDRPAHLAGLLLAAPGARGRYGITTADLLGAPPSGPNSFALADLGPKLRGLRVAQFAAGLDPMDDVDWLKTVTVPYRIIELHRTLHDMGGAGLEFQQKVEEAIQWTLQPAP
jgi:pimeloyl-ACP methyl ester carboxylesterase